MCGNVSTLGIVSSNSLSELTEPPDVLIQTVNYTDMLPVATPHNGGCSLAVTADLTLVGLLKLDMPALHGC